MNIFGWNWDKGSVCHFLLGFMGGLLGVVFSVLFTGIFYKIEYRDYLLRWERVKEGTDTSPETWERTKQEYFEFLLGLILGRVALTFIAYFMGIKLLIG